MKKMKAIKKWMFLCLSVPLMLSGCQSGDIDGTEKESYEYLKNLEEETYYVRHENNECEKVYFGNATFEEEDVSSSAYDDRVMWFKEDFEEIPTLYKGESLIYRTDYELNEEFTFERFENFGYSIGLCGMTPTVSGRYCLSTDPDDCNTYPDGDTDKILLLENEIVIIDTLGGKELRESEEDSIIEGDVTRCGTIKGLKAGNSYKAEIYEGTNRHEYLFKADVIILGSMEVIETTDYFFESETIINIKIPETFNTGYYMINGMGIFRYVNGNSYDENTDFNIPNIKEDLNGVSTQVGSNNNFETITAEKEDDIDIKTKVFSVDKTGQKTIIVKVDAQGDMSKIEGYLISPSGKRYKMEKKDRQFEISIDIKNLGEYTIEFLNLGNATAEVNII